MSRSTARPARRSPERKAKGDFLLIDGRLRQHTWERDGQRQSRLAIVADLASFRPNTRGAVGTTPPTEGEEKDDLPF
jgi:single-stranded DNA-binding protein